MELLRAHTPLWPQSLGVTLKNEKTEQAWHSDSFFPFFTKDGPKKGWAPLNRKHYLAQLWEGVWLDCKQWEEEAEGWWRMDL